MNRKVTLALACLGLLCAASSASAATFTWTGKGTGPSGNLNLWSAPVNWNTGGGVPGAADTAVFDVVDQTKVSTTPDIGAGQAVGGITYNAAANVYGIQGTTPSSVLTVGTGGIQNNSAFTQTIAVSVALAADATLSAVTPGSLELSGTTMDLGTHALTIAGSGDVALNTDVSGTGTGTALTKTGLGSLTLSGNNTFSGIVNMDNGFLLASSDNALGSSALSINGGLVVLGPSSPINITSANPITLAGGTLDQHGSTATFGSLTLSANSTIGLGGGGSLTFADATWNNGILTINNWNGPAYDANAKNIGGAAAPIFITAQPGADFLANVQFNGPVNSYPQGADWIAGTQELVPVPEPQAYAAVFGLGLLAFAIARRRLLKTA